MRDENRDGRLWFCLAMSGIAGAQENGIAVPAGIAALQPAGTRVDGAALRVKAEAKARITMEDSHSRRGNRTCYAMDTYEFEQGTDAGARPVLKGRSTCKPA